MSAREQLLPDLHLVPLPEETAPVPFQAEATLQLIDDVIRDIYLPFRGQTGYGTEHAILVEDRHVPHRENDAEHSWHMAFTVQVIYDNHAQLGLSLPPDFNIQKAVQLAMIHDVLEVLAPDIDAMTPNLSLLEQKKQQEKAAHELIRTRYPYLQGVADLWEEYEDKSSFEAQLVSDIDKIASTRMICLDGGKKWYNWEGYATSREVMCARQRGKLVTRLGHLVFDALERDLDRHPEYFPALGFNPQGTLFDLA